MNELNKLEIDIHATAQFQIDALVDGEIELLTSILPELLQALQQISEVA